MSGIVTRLNQNKEWLFSGIGVVVLTLLIKLSTDLFMSPDKPESSIFTISKPQKGDYITTRMFSIEGSGANPAETNKLKIKLINVKTGVSTLAQGPLIVNSDKSWRFDNLELKDSGQYDLVIDAFIGTAKYDARLIINYEPDASIPQPGPTFRYTEDQSRQFAETDLTKEGSGELQDKTFPQQPAFQDCPKCPEMVFISAGSFMMGSPKQDDNRKEEPKHLVTFIKPFAVGKYEITFDEYDLFARATNRKLPEDEDWGRGSRPVINVSWVDAVAYADWLARQTGKPYRLPSEAEWEYAARAGTWTMRFWGEDSQDACSFANVYDKGGKLGDREPYPCDDGYAETAPVGRFRANNFGLYDMLGNVWEWTEDCWHDNYISAPTDGSSWINTNDCNNRVIRGGSWNNGRHTALRFTQREWRFYQDYKNNLGFRVAK